MANEKNSTAHFLELAFDQAVRDVGYEKARELWQRTLKSKIGSRKSRTRQYDGLLSAMWSALQRFPESSTNALYRDAAYVFLEASPQAMPDSVIRHLKIHWPKYRKAKQAEYNKALARALMGGSATPSGLYAVGTNLNSEPTDGG